MKPPNDGEHCDWAKWDDQSAIRDESEDEVQLGHARQNEESTGYPSIFDSPRKRAYERK